MDLSATLADLTAARDALTKSIDALNAQIPPLVEPRVTAPAPLTNLERMQRWLGTSTLGIYTGVWTADWPDNHAQRFESVVAIPARNAGIDYVMFKTGEWGLEWYNGTFPQIRDVGLKHGLGVAPYYYCHPETVQKDIAICARNAQAAGGVVLDVEDEFALNHKGGIDTRVALWTLVTGIRAQAPQACIIVTGYGDPAYHFGNNFPHDVIVKALEQGIIQGYQPQWYFSVWDKYREGWAAAIQWGDADCAQAYGRSVPIQPCIMSQGMRNADYEPVAAFLRHWGASLCIWEWQNLFPNGQPNMNVINALKAGLRG